MMRVKGQTILEKCLHSVIFAALLTTGCAFHWVEINGQESKPESPHPSAATASDSSKPIAAIDEFSTSLGGQHAQAIRNSYIRQIEERGIFSRVLISKPEDSTANPANAIMTFALFEYEDNHVFMNGMKRFFTGFTFFLATPILPQRYDFHSNLTMHVRWSDGGDYTYVSKASGEAHWQAFAHAPLVGESTRSAVREFNLAHVLAALEKDMPRTK